MQLDGVIIVDAHNGNLTPGASFGWTRAKHNDYANQGSTYKRPATVENSPRRLFGENPSFELAQSNCLAWSAGTTLYVF
jgi:hypothetical protein